MKNQFDPNNTIIQLCIKGIIMEEQGNHEEAMLIFEKAWSDATDDYERFMSSYHLGLYEDDDKVKIQWFKKSVEFALILDDVGVCSALPAIYSKLGKCYESLQDYDKAKENYELSKRYMTRPADLGPFYHGTKAQLRVGDMLVAGGTSNYKDDFTMNHIYFTANLSGAGLAAALAKGDGEDKVYIIEPTGEFEDDPNVTDKKFPGNLTRSYRSKKPLKIIGEVADWKKQTDEDTKKWRERLAENDGEIIN